MVDFPNARQLGSLQGHSIGREGDFVPGHHHGHDHSGHDHASHDHSTCTDASCHICQQNSSQQDSADALNQGSSGGGQAVRSSDKLGFVWETDTINYSFDGSAFGFESFNSGFQDRFEDALDIWSNAANIGFQETSSDQADWLIVWDPRSDGPGGVLGTAFFRDTDRDGIMEQGEDRVLIVMDPADTRFFFPTAIHEAGHGLGLAHIDHTPSIMSTFLNPGRTNITAYDTQVVQSLYGAPGSGAAAGQNNESDNSGADNSGTVGADNIVGAAGNDVLSGGNGSDTISGGSGDDLLYGNRQTDLLLGGSGDDTLFGGQNNGPLSGTPQALREGQDTVSGGSGDDLIYGNHGSDQLFGDSGADTIFGGQDGDLISGGTGNDELFGNLGADTFIYSASNEGMDIIRDYQTEDAIRLTGGVTVASRSLDSDGDTVIQLSSGTRIELIGHDDPDSVRFEIV